MVTPVNRISGIDYRFSDPGLLQQALTHRSFGSSHYERLEFLGDGLLNFVVAELLFERRPEASEGDLSRLRSRLVRDRTLAELARELDIGQHLRLGMGERKSGGFLRESILADAIESIFGAILLDGGFEEARRVIHDLIDRRERSLPDPDDLKDPKTRLQELLQGRGHELPVYEILAESGADHIKRFEVECRVGDLADPVHAEAGSRRKAEQAAARLMYERLMEYFERPETRRLESQNRTGPSSSKDRGLQ